jgi:multidrug efflux pump subunit AcrA (membrane-fusion protein)
VVTAKLDAGLAADVHRGDRVRVTLPDGREVGGRVTRVGTVATAGQEGEAPTVELRVALNTRRHGRLDGAPVSISLQTGRTKDALAVPVTALVATAPGRYAVELAGTHRLVPVELGAFADDWVQVTGSALAPGTRVVVPR